MSDDHLNRLIDEVARQMTAGRPASDFRARVLARLDRPTRQLWRPLWIVAPLGALAVAAFVIFVARPFQGRDRGPERAALHQSDQPLDRTASTEARAGNKPEVAHEPPTENGSRASRLASRETRVSSRPSDAAAPIAALAPPRLELAPLSVETIDVEPLGSQSIAVPQLDPPTPITVDPLQRQ